MKLNKPLYESNYIQFVKLPSVEHPGDVPEFCPRAVIMGWGTTNRNSFKIPMWLQCAKVSTITFAECKRVIPITENAMCTSVNDKQDTCNGDSGGPLMCGNIQYGITSWGVECATIYPAVYTRVDKYLDFIRYSMKNTQTNKSNSKFFIILSLFVCKQFDYNNTI